MVDIISKPEMYISIKVYKGTNNSFIARCPELNLSSMGETEGQAVERLKEEIICCLYLGGGKYSDWEIEATAYLYKGGKPKIH